MTCLSIKTALNSTDRINTRVQIQGWVRTRRDSKAGISFLQVSDGSCFDTIQVVAADHLPNYLNEILRLTAGCAVRIDGVLVASEGKQQSLEIQAETIEVFGWVDDPDTYPIAPKKHTMEYLREVAHLRPRTNTFGALTRIRHTLSQAIHHFFHEHGFYWIHTPIITTNDCEGAGELFRVSTLDLLNLPKTPNGKINFGEDFFGEETFLTVSGQLNVESYCLALSKVYTFGPTFRAENSNTSRHLAEFWMIEPEIAFANLDDDITLAESLLKHLFATVLKDCAKDIAFFQERIDPNCISRLEMMLTKAFTRIDYTEAIQALLHSKKQFVYPVRWGLDLQSEHERYLAEEWVGGPTVVMNYPQEIKSFYMRLNDDEKTVAAMDILAPGIGEIVGGSQREERLEILDKRMDALGMDKNKYDWYRDLRRYGSVPHAGFGLGFERLLSYVTGLTNVRDVIPFPRTPKHARF